MVHISPVSEVCLRLVRTYRLTPETEAVDRIAIRASGVEFGFASDRTVFCIRYFHVNNSTPVPIWLLSLLDYCTL